MIPRTILDDTTRAKRPNASAAEVGGVDKGALCPCPLIAGEMKSVELTLRGVSGVLTTAKSPSITTSALMEVVVPVGRKVVTSPHAFGPPRFPLEDAHDLRPVGSTMAVSPVSRLN